MPYVKVYYQKCPTCGQTWSSRLVENSTEVRVGKEVFVCKCGTTHPTGNVEWAHLDAKQRKGYFFGSAEIGSVIICTFFPALFAYLVMNGWHSALTAAMWGFLFGLAVVALLWSVRMVNVRLSLRRCPHDNPAFVPGAVPWHW